MIDRARSRRRLTEPLYLEPAAGKGALRSTEAGMASPVAASTHAGAPEAVTTIVVLRYG